MKPSELDRLNRLIAAAGEISKAAERLVSAALYLRERASEVRQDDQAILDRCMTRIEEQMGYLR